MQDTPTRSEAAGSVGEHTRNGQTVDSTSSASISSPGSVPLAAVRQIRDPDDPSSPAAFGIPVQHGALERFTRYVPDDTVVQPATYLLRHVANPIEGMDPPSDWEVIGRLDATTHHAISPPPSPADTVRPEGLDWEPGLERQPPADSWWTYTTAWEGSFASVHEGRDRVLSSWVSPDGKTWQGTALPRGISSVRALLRLDDRLAIIANEKPYDRVWQYEIWVSGDGLNWKRAGRQRIPTPKRFDSYRRNVQGYWSLGDKIVALETYTTLACCGRTPGWMLLAAGKREPDVSFTWSSRNGKS